MVSFDLILGIVLVLAVSFVGFKYRNTIKRKLQERIEKNALKVPQVSWTDRKGNTYTEDVIIKRSMIPLVGDWGRIYPPIDEYGRTNWINTIFGGKKNFIKLLIVLGIIVLILIAFYEIFTQYEALKDSCIIIGEI